MDEDLISKKDLLELTDISYGQLYRWKRKNLIPEQWFIRRSTFTGQETFFPKKQIIARIDRIKNMKDDLSLDELADMFSPTPAEVSLSPSELVERNIVSKSSIDLFTAQFGRQERFTFAKALVVYIADKLLQTGEMNLEEGRSLMQTLTVHIPKFEGKPSEMIFIRKMGVSAFMLTAAPADIHFDHGVRIVSQLPVGLCIEELKLRITREEDDGHEQ